MAQTVKPLLRTAAGKNSLFDVSLITFCLSGLRLL